MVGGPLSQPVDNRNTTLSTDPVSYNNPHTYYPQTYHHPGYPPQYYPPPQQHYGSTNNYYAPPYYPPSYYPYTTPKYQPQNTVYYPKPKYNNNNADSNHNATDRSPETNKENASPNEQLARILFSGIPLCFSPPYKSLIDHRQYHYRE